jgi:hypothetical protein
MARLLAAKPECQPEYHLIIGRRIPTWAKCSAAPMRRLAGKIGCPTEQSRRNQAPATAGEDRRNRLSHQGIGAV